ncbi:MAG: (E)-4-hydroxy-3-methylbut-2-enyl-diphosphate synthase [Bacteroidales bacterium]|nr:(E)-4-hydroxy-3-methylbut-2-enyl-diphosphate synthase [Bacteroidales bacterium]
MSKIVRVGNLLLGGDNPVRVQSMTNTDTADVVATAQQVADLVDAGCELVRITTKNIADTHSLYDIKNELLRRNIYVPLIADVHFNPKVAEAAAAIVEKVRINPGNYIDKNAGTPQKTEIAIAQATENIAPLVEICKKYDTAIRIGANHGSLSNRIIQKYGNTPTGMVASVLEFVDIFQKLDFHNLVLSLKSSNPLVMIEANRMLAREMQSRGDSYPIHLGVTEAGAGIDARLKSLLGIGSLLTEGIGDTIRVSLSETPVNEIAPAKTIATLKSDIKRYNIGMDLNVPNTDLIVYKNPQDIPVTSSIIALSKFTLRDACEQLENSRKTSPVLFLQEKLTEDNCFTLLYLLANYYVYGICVNADEKLIADILQTTKIKISKPEYISCPTCGRTEYDLMTVLEDVKKKTAHIKNVTIGVMGCIVNGPGEMLGADYGVVGFGKGKVLLYYKGKPVGKPFPQKEAGDRLVSFISTKNL